MAIATDSNGPGTQGSCAALPVTQLAMMQQITETLEGRICPGALCAEGDVHAVSGVTLG